MAVKTESNLTSTYVDGGGIIRLCIHLGVEIDFRPGQYGRLTIPEPEYTDTRGSSRSLTIVGFGEDRRSVCFATRTGPSAFKRSLFPKNGQKSIEFTGPFGNFIYPLDSSRLVFIAGGIGITPAAAFFGKMGEIENLEEVAVFHIADAFSGYPLSEDMRKLASETDLAKYFQVPVRARKDPGWDIPLHFDEMISKLSTGTDPDKVFYISGPNSLVGGLEQMLLENGIKRERIRVEIFTGY